jgi:recombination protein RecR
MDQLTKLTELLRELPGIGPRQARRLALYLVRRDRNWVATFARTLTEARSEVRTCTKCMRLFPAREHSDICSICSSSSRDASLLLLVEKDVDLENIERTGAYNGLYFVLGGTTSLLDKKPESSIRLNELTKRLSDTAVQEVVLALSATTEGDDTVAFLRERMADLLSNRNLAVTLLGRGLSTGTELEYVDQSTMQSALEGRS